MVYAVAMCKKTCNINRCFSSGLVHMWSIFVTINRFLSASFYHDQLDSTTRSLPGEIGQTGTGAIKTWPFFRVYWIHHGLLGVLLEAQKPWWKNSQSYGVSLCQTMALNKHSNKLQVWWIRQLRWIWNRQLWAQHRRCSLGCYFIDQRETKSLHVNIKEKGTKTLEIKKCTLYMLNLPMSLSHPQMLRWSCLSQHNFRKTFPVKKNQVHPFDVKVLGFSWRIHHIILASTYPNSTWYLPWNPSRTQRGYQLYSLRVKVKWSTTDDLQAATMLVSCESLIGSWMGEGSFIHGLSLRWAYINTLKTQNVFFQRKKCVFMPAEIYVVFATPLKWVA